MPSQAHIVICHVLLGRACDSIMVLHNRKRLFERQQGARRRGRERCSFYCLHLQLARRRKYCRRISNISFKRRAGRKVTRPAAGRDGTMS